MSSNGHPTNYLTCPTLPLLIPCHARQCRSTGTVGSSLTGGQCHNFRAILECNLPNHTAVCEPRGPLRPCLATRLCPPLDPGSSVRPSVRPSIFLLPHLLVQSATISLACPYLSPALIMSWLQGYCLPCGFSRHPLLPSLPFTKTDDTLLMTS